MKGHCPLFGTGSTQSYLNSGLKTVGVLSHCLAHNRVPKPLGYTQAVSSAGAGALPGGCPALPGQGLPLEMLMMRHYSKSHVLRGYAIDPVVKSPPAKAGDSRDMVSIPGVGRSLGEGNGNLL